MERLRDGIRFNNIMRVISKAVLGQTDPVQKRLLVCKETFVQCVSVQLLAC